MKQKKWIIFIGGLLFSLLLTQPVFANEKPLSTSRVDSVKINNTMNERQDEAIVKMNEYREILGLPLFNKNVLVQKASQSHANYLFKNNEISHVQTENKPGFTAAWPRDRARHFGYEARVYSEGIAYSGPTSFNGINTLFDAPYHREPIMNPLYSDVGTGYNKNGTLVVNYASDEFPQVAKEHEVVVYPSPNQKDVKTSWEAVESPNPLRFWGVTNADLKIVGYPISYFYPDGYFTSNQLVIDKILLTDESGKAIPFYDVTPERDDNNQHLIIIPKKELAVGMTYHVSVDAHVLKDGTKQDMSREWSFTTTENVKVTDINFISFDKELTNNLVVEINTNADYTFKLEKDGKEYQSGDDLVNQTKKRPLVSGDYTLTVTIPELKKELIVPVTLQKQKDNFYTEAGDWRVTFDRQGKDTEVISWLFKDVKPGMDHYDGIKFIVDNKIASGTSNDKFLPWNSANRGQMAKMITNALELPIPSNLKKSLAVYDDVNEKSDYAKYIAAVTDAGIFKGSAIKGSKKRKFGTYTYINREQMATSSRSGLRTTR